MTPASIPLRVIQGTTLNKVLRLMQPGRVYKEISAIAAAAPVLITVPGHGLSGTWPAWFRGVTGLNGINREPDTAAAVLHDFLYRGALLPREQADRVFFNALRSSGIARWRAWLMFLGVRLFGASRYGAA